MSCQPIKLPDGAMMMANVKPVSYYVLATAVLLYAAGFIVGRRRVGSVSTPVAAKTPEPKSTEPPPTELSPGEQFLKIALAQETAGTGRSNMCERLHGPESISAGDPIATVGGKRSTTQYPDITDDVKECAIANSVHVYNVGPFDHTINAGSWGTFHIPACLDGKFGTCSEMTKTIPGIWHEPVITDQCAGLYMELAGIDIAKNVIGNRSHVARHNDVTHAGVFIGSAVGTGSRPSEDEMAVARVKTERYLAALLMEIDYEHIKTVRPEWPEETLLEMVRACADDKHLRAAYWMGIRPEWKGVDVVKLSESYGLPLRDAAPVIPQPAAM